jgi:hypothetical protein
VEPVVNTVEPVVNAVEPVVEPVLNQPIVEPVLNQPVVEPVLNQPIVEPVTASISEPVYPSVVAKTDGPLVIQPPLFDTSLLLGGQLTSLAAETAAVVKGLPGEIPDPLLPAGFPSSTPPVGSTFRGGSGMEIGLDLLAVLALLLVLSRTGGSSVSPRESFKLISSPRLVTELPG